MMNTVHIVKATEYDLTLIVGVFATRASAEAYVAEITDRGAFTCPNAGCSHRTQNFCLGIEEYDVIEKRENATNSVV